jgi:hypothetical protein
VLNENSNQPSIVEQAIPDLTWREQANSLIENRFGNKSEIGIGKRRSVAAKVCFGSGRIVAISDKWLFRQLNESS